MPNKIILPYYVVKLVIDIIICSFVVAYKVVTNKKIKSYLSVEKPLKTGLHTAIFANSITITPGTIAIDVSDSEIEVHNFD